MSNTAPLILGIAALGGIGYMIMSSQNASASAVSSPTSGGVFVPGSTDGSTGGSTGGSTTNGGSTSVVSTDGTSGGPSGGTSGGSSGGTSGGSGGSSTPDVETIEAKWKKRGEVSKSYNRRTCDLNGWKGKVYTEATKYAPGTTVKIAVLAQYYETSGDNDWWGYCGGGNVPASWYGNDEKVYTGIKVTSDEDPSSVITVQNYGTYPQSPDATGGSAVTPSGDLTQSVLDACHCRGESTSAKNKWGLAVYSFTAPETPGRYTVEFKMGLSDPSGPCSAQSRSTTFSISVDPNVTFGAESTIKVLSAPNPLAGVRFTPFHSVQSNHSW